MIAFLVVVELIRYLKLKCPVCGKRMAFTLEIKNKVTVIDVVLGCIIMMT